MHAHLAAADVRDYVARPLTEALDPVTGEHAEACTSDVLPSRGAVPSVFGHGDFGPPELQPPEQQPPEQQPPEQQPPAQQPPAQQPPAQQPPAQQQRAQQPPAQQQPAQQQPAQERLPSGLLVAQRPVNREQLLVDLHEQATVAAAGPLVPAFLNKKVLPAVMDPVPKPQRAKGKRTAPSKARSAGVKEPVSASCLPPACLPPPD